MKNLEEIKKLLTNSESDNVISATQEWIEAAKDRPEMAEIYYLRGNAYRQMSQWGKAMTCYLHAMELQPDGPAAKAYDTAKEIMDYYSKDYYNP